MGSTDAAVAPPVEMDPGPDDAAATTVRGRASDAPTGPASSPAQKAYFDALHAEAARCYAIAKQARRKGLDPSMEVEMPMAEDLAARVEAQVGPVGVAHRIRAVTRELGNRELVSLRVAREVAAELADGGQPREKCLDQAVRTGLSILTEGVLVAPLEGIAEVHIGHNADGTDYVDLWFAGPIRAAGGTGQAMSVLIADVVRRELGVGAFVPTDGEVERYKEEIPAYKQAQNLQYTPTSHEIDIIARNCPVCINGEGTEDVEVTGNRDLPRVEGNRLRGGACLVMAEGLVLKAPKIMKHVDNLGLEGWAFLDVFVRKAAADDEDQAGGDGIAEIPPNPKFVKDIIAGRPVFAHPSRPGGFRLRYGRARTAGLASTAVHPAAMVLLDEFLAVGTQMKVERPGKGTLATPCDTIDGPTALLDDGSLVRLASTADAKRVKGHVAEILDLGELLVPFGEFAENNALLPDASWCEEWWRQLVQAAGHEPPERFATPEEAIAFAETTDTPLHPDATLLWHDLDPAANRDLGTVVLATGAWRDGRLVLPRDTAAKAHLETLLCLHDADGQGFAVAPGQSLALLRGLGLDIDDEGEARVVDTPRRKILFDPCQPDFTTRFPGTEIAERLAGFRIMPRAPTRIGARVGRPEKADVRKMKPPLHGLFPIGQADGAQRRVTEAASQGTVEVELGIRACTGCGNRTWRSRCERCQARTEPVPDPPGRSRDAERIRELDLRGELDRVLRVLKMNRPPGPVKGVVRLMNKTMTPEPLEKAVLRAKHGVWVFKDGTVRYDMTDIPLTHFRPREVHASVERLRALGYTHDMHGAPLQRDTQLLELRVQDLIVSRGCMETFLSVAAFVDELLERVYGLPPHYSCRSIDDIIGQLTIGLAPHTSGGVLSRIIGWSDVQAHFAHPYFHAAKRRNCDGDEDAVMLLMDGLLNFSRCLVPDRRGGLMDLPLVLTTRIDPNEVDKEAHNVDTLSVYPLSFFEATRRHAHPKEVAETMGLAEKRIGTPAQYEGFGFTHDTSNIAQGPRLSAYKVLDSTMEKLTAQMDLARRIRAVDEPDVGARVIGTHLLPDIMGNLKAFSRQKMRCTRCGASYRRMPLKGSCLKCGHEKLTLTVYEKSVRKYLEVAKQIGEKYNIDAYTRQRIHLLEAAVESLFQNDKVRRARLDEFL